MEKKLIMILPEFSLFAGSHGSKSCGKCLFVKSEWVMFENYFYVIRILVEHLLKQRHKFAAVWSLKVAEYGNHNFGICRTQKRRTLNIEINNETDIKCFQCFPFTVYEIELFTRNRRRSSDGTIV